MWDWIAKFWVEALFAGILTLLTWGYRKINALVKQKSEEQNTLVDGMKAILHDRIHQAYEFYYRKQGYCSIHDMENIEGMFQAYKALGGNGIIDEQMERIKDLPTEP
ncbi:hypothetical protein LJC20_00550 [Eubacteriales bacterium OttesenSCG-928-M02]|nr:hypothetical protein [Eubacteriales bacterium OttesenSCG-928-M02]